MVKPGDLVTRQSYNSDLLFKVIAIDEELELALLKGTEMRLIADAPLSDLMPASDTTITVFEREKDETFRRSLKKCMRQRQLRKEKVHNRSNQRNSYEIPGRVLHLDGDPDYLQDCMQMYDHLGLTAYGESMPEKKMPVMVKDLLRRHKPEMLVITGHDAFLKTGGKFDHLSSYRNSRYFVEAVRRAREYEPGKDTLIIFAGACQSHYEQLLEAGANFASSPQRVLIHALDPVLVMEGVGFTPISSSVDLFQVIEETITGYDGIGGIETRGQFRLGVPRSPY